MITLIRHRPLTPSQFMALLIDKTEITARDVAKMLRRPK